MTHAERICQAVFDHEKTIRLHGVNDFTTLECGGYSYLVLEADAHVLTLADGSRLRYIPADCKRPMECEVVES